MDCGGKRQRHAAFGGAQCERRSLLPDRLRKKMVIHEKHESSGISFVSFVFFVDPIFPPEIPSEGGVALSLAAAVQGALVLLEANDRSLFIRHWISPRFDKHGDDAACRIPLAC